VHDLAVRQHHLGAQHVVDGEAVLQAVRAAGVLATLPPIEQTSCEDGSGA
jgi:hypothetical protein